MVDWHSAADSKLPADVPETLLTAVHPDMLCAVHKQKTVGAYLCQLQAYWDVQLPLRSLLLFAGSCRHRVLRRATHVDVL